MSGTTAVIGAGTMGSQMIRRLVAAGHVVQVYDIADPAMDAATEAGAKGFASAAEAAEGAEVCILSLAGPDDVQIAVEGVGGVLQADDLPAVIVDMSTIDPSTSRSVGEAATQRSVGFLDAPVLGRPDRCGNWTLVVGGDTATLERARPSLEPLAANIVPIGPIGSGVVVKLLNNLMFGAINAITAECLAGAERLGVDPAVFVRTIADSGAASVSNLFLDIGPRIVESNFDPAFTVSLLRKDVQLATEMLEDAEARAPMSNAIARLNDRALDAGLGPLDTSAMVQIFRDGFEWENER